MKIMELITFGVFKILFDQIRAFDGIHYSVDSYDFSTLLFHIITSRKSFHN